VRAVVWPRAASHRPSRELCATRPRCHFTASTVARSRHALEFVFTSVLEGDAGAGLEIDDRSRDKDLAKLTARVSTDECRRYLHVDRCPDDGARRRTRLGSRGVMPMAKIGWLLPRPNESNQTAALVRLLDDRTTAPAGSAPNGRKLAELSDDD
jgi:hypothetical protein